VGLEALVGDRRADQVGRRPEQGLEEPAGLGAEGGLGQGGQLAQGRRRAVLGAGEQGDAGRGPAGEALVGVGVGLADHRPQVLDGPLQGGVEGQRRPVVAGGQGGLVAQVEAEPEACLQLQVGGHPAGPDAAVLVRAELEAPPPPGQLLGRDAAAGAGGRLQHQHLQPGPGQVAGADQAVVAAADDHHLARGHRLPGSL